MERQELNAAMGRLAAGDRRALRPVFEALHPLVRRWCLRLLRHEADADDATQLALERFFFKAPDYDARGDALGWALAIATAECRTLARRTARRRETSDALLPDVALESEAEGSIARGELREALLEVTGSMRPEDVQTLLAWIEAEPRPPVPAATFRKRLERAMGRLRTAWRARYGVD